MKNSPSKKSAKASTNADTTGISQKEMIVLLTTSTALPTRSRAARSHIEFNYVVGKRSVRMCALCQNVRHICLPACLLEFCIICPSGKRKSSCSPKFSSFLRLQVSCSFPVCSACFKVCHHLLNSNRQVGLLPGRGRLVAAEEREGQRIPGMTVGTLSLTHMPHTLAHHS